VLAAGVYFNLQRGYRLRVAPQAATAAGRSAAPMKWQLVMALFPSQGARREQNVVRFYNSFVPTRVATNLPAAAPKG